MEAPGDLQISCSEYLSVVEDENTWGYWILGPPDTLWPRKRYLVGTRRTSCLPQPSAWEMGMWCTVVGTVRLTCLYDQGAVPSGCT